MIVVTGRARVPAERLERFTAAATAMCSASREEEGCFGYRAYADLEQPEEYIFVEEWRDWDALQTHFGTPHMAAFITELSQILSAPADIRFHSVASTKRMDPERGLVDD